MNVKYLVPVLVVTTALAAGGGALYVKVQNLRQHAKATAQASLNQPPTPQPSQPATAEDSTGASSDSSTSSTNVTITNHSSTTVNGQAQSPGTQNLTATIGGSGNQTFNINRGSHVHLVVKNGFSTALRLSGSGYDTGEIAPGGSYTLDFVPDEAVMMRGNGATLTINVQ